MKIASLKLLPFLAMHLQDKHGCFVRFLEWVLLHIGTSTENMAK